MTIYLKYNVLKHRKYFQEELYEDVLAIAFDHQPKNGDWLILAFKPKTPNYERFKNQDGILYINFDRTADTFYITK